MALEKLEIYQTAFDLMVHIEECVRDFSRYFKYTVGSELRQMCSGILSLSKLKNGQNSRGFLMENPLTLFWNFNKLRVVIGFF